MEPKLLITIAIGIAGALGAFEAGRRSKCGGGGGFAIALVIQVIMFVLINIALPACVSEKLCVSGGDTDLSYIGYLLFAFPAHWFVALIGALLGKDTIERDET